MRKKSNFHDHNFDDYINFIKNDPKFKLHTIKTLFDNLHKNDAHNLVAKDSVTVESVFQNHPWSEEMGKQVNFIIHHFPYALEKLLKALKETNKHIVALREKYFHIIKQREQESCEDSEIALLFDKLYSLNENQLNKTRFTLSFMQQSVIWSLRWKYEGHNQDLAFILGNNYKKTLVFENNVKSTSAEQLFYILGDQIRYNAINLLKKYKRLTLSELSRLADISPSHAYNVINLLKNNFVIHESLKEGKKIYYSLNSHFFISSMQNFENYINNIASVTEGSGFNE